MQSTARVKVKIDGDRWAVGYEDQAPMAWFITQFDANTYALWLLEVRQGVKEVSLASGAII